MQTNAAISIENQYIRRDFSLKDKHILTDSVCNKRINKTLKLQSGSEDFIIRTISADNTNPVILSSALLVKDTHTDVSDNGNTRLTISYEPYELNGVTYTIAQIITAEKEKHYLRSFLEISVSDKEKAQIDSIDIDSFVLPEDATGVWAHPDDSEISSMWIGKHELMLGQPVYANGLFMGSEFPANDNIIRDNTIQIRYYSGKTFSRLAADGQLNDEGAFVTWPNVIGAAAGTDTAVVQTDFFAYIEDIATPTHFRKQYNSWYDNMMGITDESIAASFNGAEAGLTKNGIEPLDSYVVDDGWNNYYDGKYTDEPGPDQGTTPNQTGFWEFNAKFPNELYTSSALADKFQSTFGVWIGPQGGYNYYETFAKFLEANGTGYVQPNSALKEVVCTGSRRYLANFEKMAIDYQERFNVDYWKWDGFASRPCDAKNHDHMTGGDHNMYFTSDMWEAWTDLFDNVRAARAKEGKDLFINATCYINLSPWLLQWVNTIWVQDSGDTGEIGTGERHQQKIYYRDKVYYQLYKQNQIQFPLKNIYNHDPIYGVSDNSNATTEVFREFLFANAVRGTAFWELYYSPSIMDDAKWKVTADALDWAEENHEILKHAKLFGNKPSEGVYGYSSWEGCEGILSFTNPLDTVQTYSLEITDIIGADKALQNVSGVQVHPYKTGALQAISYGDTVHVELKPHETIIYHYGHKSSSDLAVVSAKITGEQTVTVKFNKRIQSGTFMINGKSADAELKEDYRTFVVNTAETLTDGAEVVMKDISDFDGNTAEYTLSLSYYKDNTINIEDTLCGTGDFTVCIETNAAENPTTLFTSADEVRVSVNTEGFVEFKVKDLVLTSEETITTVVEKAHGRFATAEYVPTTVKTVTSGKVNDGNAHTIYAVREPNGMLKLYVDGRFTSSLYDKEHLNEELKGGKMTAGASVKLLNRAVSYTEV